MTPAPAGLAYFIQAAAGIEVVPSSIVGPGLVTLWRGDLVVWCGPHERLSEAPKDCGRLSLHPADFKAWFPEGTSHEN